MLNKVKIINIYLDIDFYFYIRELFNRLSKYMGISLKDIAQALNLSKATVSWVLSGQGNARGISEERIKEVQEYAAKVNYCPNRLARSLFTGTTQTLGLIIPFIGDTFFAQIAQAVEIEAEKQGYVLTICSYRRDGQREIRLIQILREKQVDGLIIVPSEKTQDIFGQLLCEKVPFVLIDRCFPQLKTNYVIFDNTGGSYRLTESLIRRNCRKIAYINTDVHLSVMGLRLKGYISALEDNNMSFDNNLYVEISTDNYLNETNEKIEYLLKNVPDVDGIVFSTHYLAIETIRCFTQMKIPYREQFKIASFHSNTALEVLVPDITIARVMIEEMGRAAVNILLENIKRQDMEKKELILDISYERN